MRRVLGRAPIVLAGPKYLIKRAIWYHVYVQPEMTTKEILSSITKLRRALLSRGDVCLRTVEMLALAQDEVAREEIRNARQITLERWFGGHAPEEVTMCDE